MLQTYRQNVRENLLLALDTIRTHKFRSFLTVLGVLIGTTTVIAVTSIIASGPISSNIAARNTGNILVGTNVPVGGCGGGSPEETFLRQDLAANPGRHVIAMWHRPLFSSGLAGDNADFVAWWNDLYAAHAEIVLNGHDHDYERFSQQSPYGLASPDGIREFVVGTGGATLRGFHVQVAAVRLAVGDKATV